MEDSQPFSLPSACLSAAVLLEAVMVGVGRSYTKKIKLRSLKKMKSLAGADTQHFWKEVKSPALVVFSTLENA